jgi:hypothetical protein
MVIFGQVPCHTAFCVYKLVEVRVAFVFGQFLMTAAIQMPVATMMML